ncbi:DUF523 domain-containing protein [Motiliproteus sediminis]|uniref:DUF523 domain-containing protein n=1 Tax=Motiliproteus sediminis TaxID=1468178 RepID=UPI001AEF9D94|nr:DUF523 domain-containing protein [Motiliproteus sediminis]
MDKILISRCLLGEPVRYDGAGKAVTHALLRLWQQQGRLVPVCPEMAGGLGCPRPAAEIRGGRGSRVLDGQAQVTTSDGLNVSRAFIRGAEVALHLCRTHDIRYALLKSRSPSCGNAETYDGSFSGSLVAGEGVTAALLQRHGIHCYNESQLQQLAAQLDQRA